MNVRSIFQIIKMCCYLVLIFVYCFTYGVQCEGPNIIKPIDFNKLKHFFDTAGDTLENTALCAACENAINGLIVNRRNLKINNDGMLIILHTACEAFRLFVNNEVCRRLVKLNYKAVLYIIDHKTNLTANHVCAMILQPKKCKDNSYPKWKINIKSGVTPPRKIVNPEANPLNILHITDIHYDPEYSSTTTANCYKPLCCQTDSGKPKKASDKAGYWTDYRNCDIPFNTFEKTLDYIKQNLSMDYVYFTGDIISHKIWDTSIEGNEKDIDLIYSTFQEYFPNTPIFPVIGNHEPHPLNLFSPDELKNTEFSTQWLFDKIWDNWQRWLPAETKSTVLRGGYYTYVVKPGFRIITLNNNVGVIYNFWILLNEDDTYSQLQWFADTLDIAETNGEIVHVLMHCPNGDSETYIPWARQFAKIVERYSNTIAAFFYGHLHTADINVLYKEQNQNVPIGVGFNGGSLTPYSNYNPNFRMYIADSINMNILDYDEYIFNLTAANTNMNSIPWYKLYSFKNEYGVSSMSPEDLSLLVVDMTGSKELRDKYYKNQVRYGDLALATGCDRNCHMNNICKYVSTVYDDWSLCNELSIKIN